jgi:hypothetical protein
MVAFRRSTVRTRSNLLHRSERKLRPRHDAREANKSAQGIIETRSLIHRLRHVAQVHFLGPPFDVHPLARIFVTFIAERNYF